MFGGWGRRGWWSGPPRLRGEVQSRVRHAAFRAGHCDPAETRIKDGKERPLPVPCTLVTDHASESWPALPPDPLASAASIELLILGRLDFGHVWMTHRASEKLAGLTRGHTAEALTAWTSDLSTNSSGGYRQAGPSLPQLPVGVTVVPPPGAGVRVRGGGV